MSKRAKQVQTTVQLPSDLHAFVEAIADREYGSVSGVIRRLVAEAARQSQAQENEVIE
jgi:Arc/MetJ-type ribon-helix-helix transcriptional regulator